MGMLCTIGVFIVAESATLFVLAMIFHPGWQQKVRDQVDEVVEDGMLGLIYSSRPHALCCNQRVREVEVHSVTWQVQSASLSQTTADDDQVCVIF
jgi:hypothetical protein